MSPKEILAIVSGLLGGLAVFIYGMNLMGDGLQKAAGERMRRILEVLTSNPIIAIIVGALVTMILQSSSATTVMVVGFVSARLMTLPQGIGVIMGANIGTTITAQLIAFKIGDYAPLVAAIGFICFFFFQKKMVKYIGQTVFAFGLLFVGLNLMGDAMEPLAGLQVFKDGIIKLSDYPVLGLLVGALMTAIVQSSSATIAVLQEIASKPGDNGEALINLKTSIPILFGSNIGTTITAIFASIGAKLNAKRAAAAHAIFNVLGSVIFVWFIPAFAKFVTYISPEGSGVDAISRQIANAHTTFNVLNTLVWLPLIWVLAKIVTFLIKGEEELVIEKRIIYLDNKILNNPSIAMDLATKELTRMATMAQQMMAGAKNAFVNSDMNECKKVHEIEDTVDMLQGEIVNYLSTMLSQGTLTERQSIRLAGLMHVTNDIERMGDQCQNVAEAARIKYEEKLPFSNEAIEEITDAFNKVNQMVDDAIHALRDGDFALAKKVLAEETDIDELESSLRQRHIERLNSGLCNPTATIIFVELIHNLEKIADHSNNIAEAVIDDYGSKAVPVEAK